MQLKQLREAICKKRDATQKRMEEIAKEYDSLPEEESADMKDNFRWRYFALTHQYNTFIEVIAMIDG